MSRWWPETVSMRIGGKPVPAAWARAEPGGAAPPAAVARAEMAFADFVQRLDALALPPRTRLDCWLGHDLARLLVVPWQADLTTAAAQQAFARHCFQEVYGAATPGWQIRVDALRYGRAALACAVDARLVERIDEALRTRSLRLARLRPLLMVAFNRDAAVLRGTGQGWWVIGESDWLTLLRIEDGRPAAVRTVGRAEQPLQHLLEREARLAGHDVSGGQVWMLRGEAGDSAAEQAAQQLRAAGWAFQWLDPLPDSAAQRPLALAAEGLPA